ncbi:MAG TPA: 1-acyl-sn-glycerol-3-phosphate acyltransferase [Lentimicrobium sp.]|jgi:putative hemolysin|nr:1-acyl-sn-glycerol-3-phosphate acyltransferase [Lentimicrobium sp.]
MQSQHIDTKFIDVDKVIAGKNPRLLKVLPRFVINYLKRILHQDRMNEMISRFFDKQGLDFIEAVLTEFNVKLRTIGIENVDPVKNYVVISNHPLGGLDGMALMLTLGKINPQIAMTANDFLMHVQNLKSLFLPINKHGSNAENIAVINECFASEKVIIFFPAGLCSRKIGNQIIDLEWKKTFLSHARKFNREILPVHISGRNSSFFYNLANLRKRLRMKSNIEMLYLVDEMFKQNNKDIVITFGKPISVNVFDKNIRDKEWAAQLKNYVYQLGENPKAEFIKTIV